MRVINEGLREPSDMKTKDIDKDNIWIIDYVKDKYLYYLQNNND